MKKNIIIAGVVVIVILAATAIWWRQQPLPVSKYSGPTDTIRLALNKSGPELSGLIWLAEQKGYFKDEGLDVQITQETNGLMAQEKVAAGNADIGVDSDFGFVSDSFTLSNLRILAGIDQAKVIDIIARKDRGINAPADLVGKKIGVTPKIATEFFLGQFLTANNISLNQVQVIYLPLADEQAALMSGKVDAVSTNDPYSYSIKMALGGNDVEWSAQPVQALSWLVVSNAQFLTAHPQAAEHFLAALVSAENFLQANPEASKEIIRTKLADDDDYFNQNWSKHQFAVDLNQSLLVTMESEARWAIANKITDRTTIPDYLGFIYLPALTKVEPAAVTIIH